MIILKNYPLVKEVFNTLPIGIIVLDDDTKIIYANKSIEELTGIEPSLLLNKKAESQLQGIDMAAVKNGSFEGKVRTISKTVKVACKAFKKYRILYLT